MSRITLEAESNKRITLRWLSLIKARLCLPKYKDSKDVSSFIRPILSYGNSEEKRITREFKELNLKVESFNDDEVKNDKNNVQKM
jgi:hypothetical protein